MEKNMLEAARDNGGFSTNQPSQSLISTKANPAKGKSKGIFPHLMPLMLNLMMINPMEYILLLVALIGLNQVQDINSNVQ